MFRGSIREGIFVSLGVIRLAKAASHGLTKSNGAFRTRLAFAFMIVRRGGSRSRKIAGLLERLDRLLVHEAL